MKPHDSSDDKFAGFICSLNLNGITGTKIILWLIAITIVSFAIGAGILAVSGGFSGQADKTISPFRHSAMFTPNVTVIPIEGATAADLGIVLGAGELTVRDGAPEGALAETTVFSKAPEWQPQITGSVNGTVKKLTIRDIGSKGKEWFAVHSPNRWEILVTDKVPVALDVEVGAGDSTLDLSGLDLSSLDVKNGAGDTAIDLSRYHGGAFHAVISNGVGDVTLRVADQSNTRITVLSGVGDLTHDGLVWHDEYFTTHGYTPAKPANEIEISQGVGSVALEAL